VRERERGTIEQLLVSPMSRWAFMLGKLIPYWIVGMAMAVFLLGLMRFLFHVPIAGSITALMLATLLYTFCLLAIGLLVSTRAETQMQALQMSMALILPSVFFSGFIFPRETMPGIFYAIGAALPTTYYIDLLRAIILRGADLPDFARSLWILLGMGILLFAACSARFRKRLQ
jgi:ABC-2 type transport system permease protein